MPGYTPEPSGSGRPAPKLLGRSPRVRDWPGILGKAASSAADNQTAWVELPMVPAGSLLASDYESVSPVSDRPAPGLGPVGRSQIGRVRMSVERCNPPSEELVWRSFAAHGRLKSRAAPPKRLNLRANPVPRSCRFAICAYYRRQFAGASACPAQEAKD